jgi:uncharacterized Tic20 family protein
MSEETRETPGPDITSAGGLPSKDARLWAMIAHLSAFAGYVLPFGNFIGPLIIWQTKKDVHPFAGEQGKEALNFQITVTLAILVCIPLMFICIGIPLAMAVGVADLVFIIIAAIKANEGVAYRYPFTLRLV